jgi:hypothetical protein
VFFKTLESSGAFVATGRDSITGALLYKNPLRKSRQKSAEAGIRRNTKWEHDEYCIELHNTVEPFHKGSYLSEPDSGTC